MDENKELGQVSEDTTTPNEAPQELNNTQVADTNVSTQPAKKKKPILIILLLIIICALVAVTVWAVVFRNKADASPQPTATPEPGILEPDKAPGDKEKNAESMGDQGAKKLDQPEGGGAVSLTYSKDVTIDLSDKLVTLMFGNPSRSNQDMVVQIVIQDNIIVQSDTLSPGYQVKKLDLDDGSRLKAGTYKGKFKILYFDADSGEKAVVNTEIPIDIEVKN